jgi:hypothetical protein
MEGMEGGTGGRVCVCGGLMECLGGVGGGDVFILARSNEMWVNWAVE